MKPLSILLVFAGLFYFSTIRAQINPTNNIIGVDITLPQNSTYTYDSALISCYNFGTRQIGLHFLWKSGLETTPGVFTFTNLDIANAYYPYFNVQVDLNIDPIETNILELPTDLVNRTFDDIVVIDRFKILLDSVFNHIPDLQLSSLVIGSEIDAYLGTDQAKWTQYITFYREVAAYAKSLRPGLKVACEAMFTGLTGSAATYLQALNSNSDYIGVSYYPINNDFTVKSPTVAASDFSVVVDLYPAKPIFFYQLGYPSSSLCNSSEDKQAKFIEQVFQSWDTYHENIKMIDFTWLHDWSAEAVNYWSDYYGISDTAFIGFLGSIGLRNWDGNGSDKQAFIELKCQAKQRGYNTLPINCEAGVTSINNSDQISIFPNPAQTKLKIELPSDLKNFHLTIYNQFGQIEKSVPDFNNSNTGIDVSNLPNGLYFIVLHHSDRQISRKFLIDK
ncbi:MAG: T9SS type A sorting domain-containing protein [Bacteroidales bacterium]|nr:T9SS type A sorting domain-containing protein [Bacteroidales bacterium]